MKNVRFLLSFVLVGLLCVTAQAEIVPGGFQGSFGNIETVSSGSTEGLGFIGGHTFGLTADAGISASFDDLLVDLADFAADGDAVSVSDLVLTGIIGDGCDGSATYVWNFANLSRSSAVSGIIAGELTLQSSSNLTSEDEPILLPQHISATLVFAGVVITSDGTNGHASLLPYPTTAIRAVSAPEPSTIVCLLVGLGTLFIWRRK